MMTICIADDKVKYASVDNIEQKGTSLIEWSTVNITAIMLSIIFPPTNKSVPLTGHSYVLTSNKSN